MFKLEHRIDVLNIINPRPRLQKYSYTKKKSIYIINGNMQFCVILPKVIPTVDQADFSHGQISVWKSAIISWISIVGASMMCSTIRTLSIWHFHLSHKRRVTSIKQQIVISHRNYTIMCPFLACVLLWLQCLLLRRPNDYETQAITPKSMGWCKKDVTPLLTHWIYVFLH